MTLPWKLFITLFVALIAIDFLWIGLLGSKFYIEQFGDMGRYVDGEYKANLVPAVGVYILLTIGMIAFVLPKIGVNDSYLVALGWGALYGLIMYGIYDLTNSATLKHWSLSLIAVDMAWGTFLNAVGAVLAKLLRDRLNF